MPKIKGGYNFLRFCKQQRYIDLPFFLIFFSIYMRHSKDKELTRVGEGVGRGESSDDQVQGGSLEGSFGHRTTAAAAAVAPVNQHPLSGTDDHEMMASNSFALVLSHSLLSAQLTKTVSYFIYSELPYCYLHN